MMFYKTSSSEFLKYGEVFTDFTKNRETYQNNFVLNVTNENLTFFYKANKDVYLKTVEGIAMLVITDSLNHQEYDEYVVHRIIKINKGNYFNFIPLGKQAKIELAFQQDTRIENIFIRNEYNYHRIKPSIRLNELIAYYYNVRNANYSFPGETSPYWEITYVDSGILYTKVGNETYKLENNSLMLYGPYQYHEQYTKDESCSYLSIILDLEIDSIKDIRTLTNKVFVVDRATKRTLDQFVEASSSAIDYNEYIMINTVNGIFVSLLSSTVKQPIKAASTPMQQNFENELLSQIMLYINENIFSNFNNVEELCMHFGISRSSLQNLFKNNFGIAPKRYILNMKLKKSKELFHESRYTVSEISSLLGFSSIHYFSRRFKQEFGISPTDYANKIYKSN